MDMLTFAVPITRLDEHKRFCQDMQGKSADHAKSRRDLGLVKERAFYQRMPDGRMLLVVHVEGPGAEQMMERMVESVSSYDRWFVERVKDVHGIDLREGLPEMPKFAYSLETGAPKSQRSTAFAAPLPPEQVDAWRQFIRECRARQPEHRGSRERVGISLETEHLADTPMGPMVLVYLEGVNDLASSGLLQQDTPFDRWFLGQINRLHGVDFRKMALQMDNAVALDWSDGKFQTVARGVEATRPTR